MPRAAGKYRYLRQIFMSFAKAAFLNHPEFPYIDGDPETSKLLVLDSWAQNEETPQKRPRIVVSRGEFVAQTPVIGPYKDGPNIFSPTDRTYLEMNSGGVMLNCVASSDLVSDDIADQVEHFLHAARDDFKQRSINIQGIVIGKPERMDKESSFSKWFYTPVSVSLLINNLTTVESQAEFYPEMIPEIYQSINNEDLPEPGPAPEPGSEPEPGKIQILLGEASETPNTPCG